MSHRPRHEIARTRPRGAASAAATAATAATARLPGATLLHPVVLASLAAMLVNDHVVKRLYPGWLSGKLSDFACLVLLPVFLHAVFELSAARLGRTPGRVTSNRVLAACAVLSAAVFAAVELSPWCERLYCVVFAALQWPFHAALAMLRGAPAPGVGLVRATADVSDLLALPMVLVGYAVAEQPVRRDPARGRALRFTSGLLLLVASTAFAPHALAEEKSSWWRHDGWFLAGELGFGVAFVESSASISNGFEQPLDSSATGSAFPVWGLELGHTVPETALVLGVRLGGANLDEPAIESGGDRFRIQDSEFGIFEGQAFVDYYPDPGGGFHTGAAFGAATMARNSAEFGQQQFGYALSLEAGHGVWLGRSWSLGAVMRASAARMTGPRFGSTYYLLPSLSASLAWH